jgi:cysteinyl-tRNA synthetase
MISILKKITPSFSDMSLHLFNTLTRTKERFKPLRQEEVKVYYCGPTPYNYAHIGNLRNYLMDDIVVRSLRYLGYKVKTTMNITDIDDKTIRDSQTSGKSLKEFTQYYTEEFLIDCKKLGIIPADNIKPISELITDMGEIIDSLVKKGYAYLADDGSIYYSVAKFKKYGQLAHLDTSGMISSVRINNDEYDKEQVADFALWKAYDETSDGPNWWEIEVTLDSIKTKIKWRPGWHIECSACNKHFFGEQIDIHMGGIDLIFPHHQNEIAQTEAFTGKPFSKYWLHGGHLLVDNKKMAKSAKNFYTLRDIVEKVPDTNPEFIYRGFRLMALQNQYRENFNFTFDRLTAAINTIKWLDEMMKRLGRYHSQFEWDNTERTARGKLKFHEISREFRDNQQAFMQDFIEKIEDDFALPEAMSIVFEYQTYINSGIDESLFSREETKSMISLLQSWNEILGFLDFSLLDQDTEIPKEIEALAIARAEAKLQKDWAEADKIRDELADKWWKMIDETGGRWRVEKV